MNILLCIPYILAVLSEDNAVSFKDKIASYKFVVVYDGVCNDECQDRTKRIDDLKVSYYLADTNVDKGAREYMKSLNFKGPYPVYFFQGRFVPDVALDEKLSYILGLKDSPR